MEFIDSIAKLGGALARLFTRRVKAEIAEDVAAEKLRRDALRDNDGFGAECAHNDACGHVLAGGIGERKWGGPRGRA